MGNCLGQSINSNRSNQRNVNVQNRKKVINKGQLLKRDKMKWKSEIPLTSFHIMSKRDEFWDTAPAFEGRQEIWDALKAAVEAIDKYDYELAQAIVDGANIILPSGTLRDSYDELGNRYQLPLYVLSYPTNLIPDQVVTAQNDDAEVILTTSRCGDNNPVMRCIGRSSSGGHPGRIRVNKSSRHKFSPSHHHNYNRTNNSRLEDSIPHDENHNKMTSSLSVSAVTGRNLDEKNEEGEDRRMILKLRLSTDNKDYSLPISNSNNVTILQAKQIFFDICNHPPHTQRWYCYGRLLDNQSYVSQCIIPYNFIIQVIVNNNHHHQQHYKVSGAISIN